MPYGNRYGGGGYAGVGSVGGEGGGLLGGFSNGLAQGLHAAQSWQAERKAQEQDTAKDEWDRDPTNPLNIYRLASAGLARAKRGNIIPLSQLAADNAANPDNSAHTPSVPPAVLAAMGASTGASAPSEAYQPPDSEVLPKVGSAEQGASAGQTPLSAAIAPPAAAIAPPAAKAAPVAQAESSKPTLEEFVYRPQHANESTEIYNAKAKAAENEWQRANGRMAIQKTKQENDMKAAADKAAQGQQLRGITALFNYLDKTGVTRAEPMIAAMNRLMQAYYAVNRQDDSALMRIAQEKAAGNADVSSLLQSHQEGQPLSVNDRAAMYESVKNTLSEEMNKISTGSNAAVTPEMRLNWLKSFPHWNTGQKTAAQFFRDTQNLMVKPKLEAVLRTLSNNADVTGKFGAPLIKQTFNNYQALHKQLFGKEWKAEDLRMANPETGQIPGENTTPVPPPAGDKIDYSSKF